jgi:hypothetical protein
MRTTERRCFVAAHLDRPVTYREIILQWINLLFTRCKPISLLPSDQSPPQADAKGLSEHGERLQESKPEISATEHVSNSDKFPFNTRGCCGQIKLLLGRSTEIIQYETAPLHCTWLDPVRIMHDVTQLLFAQVYDVGHKF